MSIVVAGHLCLDMIPHWRIGDLSALQPGNLLHMEGVTFATGGVVANTGLALQRLGLHPILMGRTGADYIGNIIRSIIAEQGIAPDCITICPGETSSYTIVLNPPDTDRIFLHFPGTNDSFTAADINFDAVEKGIFHFGYPPLMRKMYVDEGVHLQKIFRRAKDGGLATSLDLAVPDPHSEAGRAPWERILARTLPSVDFFLPSLDELMYMIDRERFYEMQSGSLPVEVGLLEELSNRLLAMGALVVIIKMGDQGLYLRTGQQAGVFGEDWANRQLLSPVFKVAVRGTTGAGDATIAGFLAGLSLGNDPQEALTLGTGVGGCSVEAVSATEGIPSLTVVQARIDAGWERVVPSIPLPGWQAGKLGVWSGPADRVRVEK